jgi:hypothetical protein
MAPLVAAAKDTRSGIVDFFVTEETAWTANVWIRPLLVLNVDRLMYKLSKLIVSLLRFAKPEMLIADYEWAEAYIEDGQFIGQLVVTPAFTSPVRSRILIILYASGSRDPAVKTRYLH